MPTTREIVPRLKIMGGIDDTLPAHLVPENRWIKADGFRSYQGRVSQLRGLVSVSGMPTATVILANIHTGIRDQVLHVGVDSILGPCQLNVSGGTYTRLLKTDGSTPTIGQDPGDLQSFNRIVGVIYGKWLYYTNPTTKLRYTDGTYVHEYGSDEVIPSGRYIDTYFDHIVMANNTFQGMEEAYTLRWSNLYNPGLWTPQVENEADHLILWGWERPESKVAGITGIGRIGDTMYAYTDSCIFRIRYVGLPKIMVFDPIYPGVGNSLHYGLAVSRSLHIFFDLYQEDFFLFDGQSLKSIGKPIMSSFLANFPLGLFTMIAIVDDSRNEVRFINRLTGQMWIYNWLVGEWSKFLTTDAILSIGLSGRRAGTIADLGVTTIDNLVGVVNSLSEGGSDTAKVYAGSSTMYQESASGTLTQTPRLETGDILVKNLQEYGEVDQLCIHADYSAGSGIDVYVSARESIQSPVVYKKVGRWTKGLREGIVSFTPMKGRVFRYAFEAVADSGIPDGYVFYGFADNLYSARAER